MQSSSRTMCIAKYIQRYQVMLAARQQDPEVLRRQYESVDEIILSIDGLQPEKGRETLYVERELTQKRVWFAEDLDLRDRGPGWTLDHKAKEWADSLGKPAGTGLWLSDKQDAFVTGIKSGVSPTCRIATATKPFPPRRGQARIGGRQPRQGSDAGRRFRGPAENRIKQSPQATRHRDVEKRCGR